MSETSEKKEILAATVVVHERLVLEYSEDELTEWVLLRLMAAANAIGLGGLQISKVKRRSPVQLGEPVAMQYDLFAFRARETMAVPDLWRKPDPSNKPS